MKSLWLEGGSFDISLNTWDKASKKPSSYYPTDLIYKSESKDYCVQARKKWSQKGQGLSLRLITMHFKEINIYFNVYLNKTI